MKLSYRGITYNHDPKAVEVIDTDAVGKYRGNTVHFHQMKDEVELQSDVELQYRGVRYSAHQ